MQLSLNTILVKKKKEDKLLGTFLHPYSTIIEKVGHNCSSLATSLKIPII